jgi:protein-disulfide isomerase
MNAPRKVEVFSAKCPACEATIQSVEALACESCEVTVLDMHEPDVAKRAKALGIQVVPAVVIDGQLAECCAGGPSADALRGAGLGTPGA